MHMEASKTPPGSFRAFLWHQQYRNLSRQITTEARQKFCDRSFQGSRIYQRLLVPIEVGL